MIVYGQKKAVFFFLFPYRNHAIWSDMKIESLQLELNLKIQGIWLPYGPQANS
jgi:hypothetical protein